MLATSVLAFTTYQRSVVPTPPLGPAEFGAALQRLADAWCPGHQGGSLILRLPSGARTRVEIGRCAELPAPPADPGTLSELEAAAIQAAEEATDTLTGEEIAHRAGYPFNSRFREALAGLVRRGRLVNDRPGYRVADA
jgi:hypothetical protein